MKNNYPPEERYPLLLLFLEDGQQYRKEEKRIFFDKSRYQGITSGVTTVFTQWPGHVSTCLTTALFIAVVTILLFMLMMVVSITPPTNFLTARCKNHIYQQNSSFSIVHLVHGPNAWTQYQLDTFEDIIKGYGSSNIDLILIQNKKPSTKVLVNTTRIKTNSTLLKIILKNATTCGNVTELPQHLRIKRNLANPFHFNINFGAKDFLRMLLDQTNEIKPTVRHRSVSNAPKPILSIADLIQKYPNISVQNLTYKEIFKRSPLFFTWQNLNEDTRLFAVRVMQIWNYAGITFALPKAAEAYKSLNITTNNIKQQDLKRYKNLINAGLPFFNNMPDGLVTVDEKGLHMETKTVCHAFFGEILMKLRKTSNDTSPSELIQDTLKSFCIKGSVDINYCKKLYETEK